MPTELKLLRGNPGCRPINKGEPKPRRALPRCPGFLDDEARREWRRIVREMAHTNLITAVDRTALAAYCQCYSRWAQAEETVQKTGMIIKTAQGNLIQNPMLGIANRAQSEMRKWASEFGLTPSSRARMTVDKPDSTADEFMEFLNKKVSSG